jgi:hypothetical protein
MRLILNLSLLLTAFSINGCQKDKIQVEDCLTDFSTIRQINNQKATVISQNGQFYLIESGTIDTRLRPCNLPQKFQVNNLQVVISGNVKSTIRNGVEPCCTENFVITKILE